ncbi:hypothetical protein VPHK375_0053 [Vibrio phage K375]
MERRYRVHYMKIGVMGNKYSIGSYEFSVDKHELKVFNGSIPNIGIAKIKDLQRHFPIGNTPYLSITEEVDKGVLLEIVDWFSSLKAKFAKMIRE